MVIKRDYRPKYDQDLIEKFRKENPNIVNDMRMNFQHLCPWASEETIEKYIDDEILPPVMEEPSWWGLVPSGALHFGAIDGLEAQGARKLPFFDKNKIHQVEALWRAIEKLSIEDQNLVKRLIGLPPFERGHTQKELAYVLGIPEGTLTYKLNKIFTLLKDYVEECLPEVEIDIEIDDQDLIES